MRKKLRTVLVTGGAGFIGSEFTRQAVRRGYKVAVIDKLTYAGDVQRLKSVKGRFAFYPADIVKKAAVAKIFAKEKPDVVVHFAAESHVDRSIHETSSFIDTNVKGTQMLLDSSRKYNVKKFIHISTDEVYGEIKKGKCKENNPLRPSSPYAASKAAADVLIASYIRTFNFPAIIVRPSNNYGPWQYPEKLIPLAIFKILQKETVPVYGNGTQKREWLYVGDCARAIMFIMEKAPLGRVYNVSSGIEKINLRVVKKIIRTLGASRRSVQFVRDRPGHDYRYASDFSRLRRLGWSPKTNFESGIAKTIRWYAQHQRWLKSKETQLRKYWEKAYAPLEAR